MAAALVRVPARHPAPPAPPAAGPKYSLARCGASGEGETVCALQKPRAWSSSASSACRSRATTRLRVLPAFAALPTSCNSTPNWFADQARAPSRHACTCMAGAQTPSARVSRTSRARPASACLGAPLRRSVDGGEPPGALGPRAKVTRLSALPEPRLLELGCAGAAAAGVLSCAAVPKMLPQGDSCLAWPWPSATGAGAALPRARHGQGKRDPAPGRQRLQRWQRRAWPALSPRLSRHPVRPPRWAKRRRQSPRTAHPWSAALRR